jgi:hypothetical protein
VIILSTWVFEHLEMSTICLGMLLGLPHLKMARWGAFIASPTIIAVGQKQQLSVDGRTRQSGAHQTCTVHCPTPWPRQPTVGVYSSRPLDPTVAQTFWCTSNSPVLQPKGAWLRVPLRLLSVPPDSQVHTRHVTFHCPVHHQCAG